MLGKFITKALVKAATKKTAGSKALTFAQRRALKKAQAESARLRTLAAKSPKDFYKGTTVRKLEAQSVKLNKKTGELTFGAKKTLTLEVAKKHHSATSAYLGKNSNLYNEKQVNKLVKKKIMKDNYDRLPTSAKVLHRTQQATAAATIGVAGYSGYQEYKRKK
jgi:hypothetical protein